MVGGVLTLLGIMCLFQLQKLLAEYPRPLNYKDLFRHHFVIIGHKHLLDTFINRIHLLKAAIIIENPDLLSFY